MIGLSTISKKILQYMSKLTSTGLFKGRGGFIVVALTYNKTDMLRLSNDIDCTYMRDFISDEKVKEDIKNIFPNSSVIITRPSSKDGTLQIEIDDIPVDIEINKIVEMSNIYSIEDLQINGCSIYDILADKLSVITSKKVFRRSKDLVDVFNLISIYDISKKELDKAFANNNRVIGSIEFLNDEKELRHAYDKLNLRSDSDKEDYDRVIDTILKFLNFDKNKLYWKADLSCWVSDELKKNRDSLK